MSRFNIALYSSKKKIKFGLNQTFFTVGEILISEILSRQSVLISVKFYKMKLDNDFVILNLKFLFSNVLYMLILA